MTVGELPNDSWFDDFQLAVTRAYLIHSQMGLEPHGRSGEWWIVKGRSLYRSLTTDVFQCDECEVLCVVADLLE